jgi:hypothetical protein
MQQTQRCNPESGAATVFRRKPLGLPPTMCGGLPPVRLYLPTGTHGRFLRLQRNGEVDMISIARDSGLVTVINSFDCEAGTREPGECVARCGSGTWRTARHRVSTEASTGPVS